MNFTQRFRAACSGDAWSAYSALRKACPTPFAGFVGLGDGAIVSLSPERFLRLQGGRVETRPIKGTRPRGHDEQSDAAQAQALLASEKDRAENLMIVDLLRNDLGRSCRIGSVRVRSCSRWKATPMSITGELCHRRARRPAGRIRSAGRQLSWRVHYRSAEDPRHADHRRAGTYPPLDLLRVAAVCRCQGKWTAPSPSVPCSSVTDKPAAGAVAASSPTRTGRRNTESIDKVKVLLETLEQLPG